VRLWSLAGTYYGRNVMDRFDVEDQYVSKLVCMHASL